MVVRCSVDAAIKLGESTQLVAVHALNEFDSKWSGGCPHPCPCSCPCPLLACSCVVALQCWIAVLVAVLCQACERESGDTCHAVKHSTATAHPSLPVPAGVDWRQ